MLEHVFGEERGGKGRTVWEEGEERRLKIEGKERREIITVRGQSYVSRLPKY